MTDLLKEVMNMTAKEKAELIDKLLASLDSPDKEMDFLWAQEAEERITAFEKGEIRALNIKEVLDKYR